MKVLHTDLADDPAALRRFEREARALRKLAHPNIVPFYGLYETEAFSFLLEQFIDGTTLKEILRRQRGEPLPIQDALVYLRDLCAALGYAHANGVVHCDIKPANVMVDTTRRVFLTDFGVARHAESTTTSYATAGTAAYMAPEQVRGDPVSAATDIYELGILLFEMLTGQRPFRAQDQEGDSRGSSAVEQIRAAHLTQPPPDPCALNPNLSRALAQVILKALEKNPANRFQSSKELLRAACEATGMTVDQIPGQVIVYPFRVSAEPASGEPTFIEAAPPAQRPPTLPAATTQPASAPPRKISGLWWGIGGIVLVAAAAGLYLLSGLLSSTSPPATAVADHAATVTAAVIAPPPTQTAPPTAAPTATDEPLPTAQSTPTRTARPRPSVATKTPALPIVRTSARVLWDASHGPRVSHDGPTYVPDGMYLPLTDLLKSSQMVVETNARNLGAVDLSSYQVVVVNEWSAQQQTYTDAEAGLLADFVQNGGGLLIMADNADNTSHSVARVCDRFDVSCYQPPNLVDVSLSSGFAITDGVSQIRFGYNGGALSTSNSSAVAGRGSGNTAVIALDHLSGRVVILGDGNLFDLNNIGNAQNSDFALNVFRWLAGME